MVNLGVVLTNIGWDDNAQREFQLAWDTYERNEKAFQGADASGARRVDGGRGRCLILRRFLRN